MGSQLRITGMATGMDTDTTIKQLMKPYQMRIDKMKQDKQVTQWRQDLYREIIGDFNSFKNSYFDVLKPDNYMLSKNSYGSFDSAVISSDSTNPAGVSVTPFTGAVSGTYKVVVDKLAESAKLSCSAVNEGSIGNLAEWNGKKININIGGKDTSIDLSSVDFNEEGALIADITAKINANPDLEGKLSVTQPSAGKVKFSVLTNDTVKIVNTTHPTALSEISGKVINPQKYSTKLSELGVAAGSFSIDYKDSSGKSQTKTITVTDPSNTTMQQLIDNVSKETSGNVTLGFSELTGKFTLQTLQMGSGATINTTDTNAILSKLGISTTSAQGIDAEVKITPPGMGVAETFVKKSSNTFTIDNVTYNLTRADSTVTNNITVTGNSDKAFDKIKGFIDKYNEMVDKINKKIDEKKQYSYLPLTDEQKKDMKEEDIKKWEDKAKEGLLKNDSMLQNMLTAMRGAFYESVENAGVSLTEIGLSTSPDTTMRGKIIIDESKLKEALKTKGEQIATLFTKTSTSFPTYSPDMNTSDRATRSKESGIFQRINDIFSDYVRTTRNKDGKKGMLLEKAGIKGDFTEFKNMLSEDMQKRDKLINDMIDKMSDKENRYYQQFAKLEQAMSNMNAQSSWLAQQLGGGAR